MVVHTLADLGKLIRARREEVGLTTTQAAELAGVSRRLLTELERGKRRNVGTGAVFKILELLGLRIDVERRGLPGIGSKRPESPGV